jgi:hypothetical protein
MSEITPEERAEHIAAEYEAYSPHVKPETAARELRLLIATAVHNAVAEEREACALIADNTSTRVFDSGGAEYWREDQCFRSGFRKGLENVEAEIRARSKEQTTVAKESGNE